MKKLIYCALALAAGLFATSCQQENLEPVAQENTVTFTVETPAALQTKAIADGMNVDELIYEVWLTPTLGDLSNGAQKLYQEDKEMTVQNGENKTIITLDLVNDQKYTVLLWAQVAGTGVYNTTELNDVHYNSTEAGAYAANDENLAAFYGVAYVDDGKTVKIDGTEAPARVELRRPFAQVNLGTRNTSTETGTTTGYTISIEESNMILRNVPNRFNVANGATSVDDDFTMIEFSLSTAPCNPLSEQNENKELPGFENPKYWYAGMNYVFASNAETGITAELEYNIVTKLNDGNVVTVNNTIPNVPLKENYRTNIVGNLLTSSTDYEVVIDANFNTNNNSGNIEVVGEGIVKNMNGDYEVTNERGLAYAINSLFAQGGDFYLTAALYDMTDYDVTSPSVPEGVELNIYGETPVVTRSATVGGVTIKGLKGSIIETNDGTVSFSGIKVEGSDVNAETPETPAFIKTNNGTADFTSCETTTQDYIAENTGTVRESDNTVGGNKDLVAEDNGEYFVKVATAEELVDAMKAQKDVFFTDNITVAATKGGYNNAGILQNNAQTIDGNGHTLTVTGAGATWDCAIYTNGGIIKNLTVAGAMRGIFTAGQKSDLYIENVEFKNVIYTFNSDGTMPENPFGVYVSGSTLNGWTSHSNMHTEVVYTNCSFGAGSGYKYCRPYGPTKFVNCAFCEGYEVSAKGVSTFIECKLNGVAVTADNIATLVTGNIVNAKLPGVDGTFVSTGEQLLEALKNDATVILANDITMAAEQNSGYGKAGIVIEPGKTINGNGKTLKVTDAGGTWDCAIYAKGGTIKNLTVAQGFRGIFMGTASGDVFIENVTFDGPTYTFNSDAGNKNFGVYLSDCTIKGWTSHSDVHKEVVYTNCTFGERGYKFCRPYGPTTFVACDFCEGYKVDAIGVSTFVECTLNGVAVTAENIATLASGNAVLPGIVTTNEEFVAALENSSYVTVAAGEYKFPASSVKAGQTIDCKEGVVFTGTSSLNINGAKVIGATFKNEGGQAVSGTIYGTFKNCTFIGTETLRWCYTTAGQTSLFENCVVKTTLRGVHFDVMDGDVVFKNCEINGFNAYSGAGTMTFEGCTFGHDSSKYNGLNIYTNTNVKDCQFNFVSGKSNFIDMEGTGKTLTIENCTATLDGEAAQVSDFVGGSKLDQNTVIYK